MLMVLQRENSVISSNFMMSIIYASIWCLVDDVVKIHKILNRHQ